MYQQKAKDLVIEKTGGSELQHYLRVFGSELVTFVVRQDIGMAELGINQGDKVIYFNLTSGKPATEQDARLFLELVEGLSDSD
jgi:hypothetical protein